MRKITLVLLLVLIFTSCTSNKEIVIDGTRYTLISTGKTNSNGTVDTPLYKKEGDDSKYYTPSLSGKYMVPLMK